MDSSKKWLLPYYHTPAATKRHVKAVNKIAEEQQKEADRIRSQFGQRQRTEFDGKDFIADRLYGKGTAVRRRLRQEAKRRAYVERKGVALSA